MPDEHKLDAQVEDLDVPSEERDDVKGGDKATPKLTKSCATGSHLNEATIIH